MVADGVYEMEYRFAAWARGQDNSPADSGDATVLLEYNYKDAGDVTRFGARSPVPEILWLPGTAAAPLAR